MKLLKEGPTRNFNSKENLLQQGQDFSVSMGTSTPNRNKKLSFFPPNLTKINETGANVFTNQQTNKPKFSISDLPNCNVLMTGEQGFYFVFSLLIILIKFLYFYLFFQCFFWENALSFHFISF